MPDPVQLTPATQNPPNFKINEVRGAPRTTGTPTPPPDLGPLATFTGTGAGTGFNTSFRPDSQVTPTVLSAPAPPRNNIPELTVTSEALSFSDSLGPAPNRGVLAGQPDIFLNGVAYLRSMQIRYSQTVVLNCNGLSWPHVSVATSIPAPKLPVTPTAR